MVLTASHTEIHPLIDQRWSPRAFRTDSISDDKLLSILKAGRRAPSSFNLQPWRFIFSKREDKEEFSKLFNVLMEPNQVWAKNAPVLLLSVAQVTNPVTDETNPYAWHDVGLAVSNMVLQAESQGLKAHQMGGFHADKAKEDLQIPQGFEPVSVTAFGYPGHPDQLPEELQDSERQWDSREPMEQLFFQGTFGRCL